MKLIFKHISADEEILFTLESNHIPVKDEEIVYYSNDKKTSISGRVVHICREYIQDHVETVKDTCVYIYLNNMLSI